MSLMKNVLITGASSGIGKALAWECAARGDNLVLLARREELLRELKREIEAAHRVRVEVYGADVTDEPALRAAVQKATAALGPIDTVVANAGFGVGGRMETLSAEDFKRQFDVNVFGVFNTFRATIDGLKATRGRLCLIGSTCSYVSVPDTVAYCMSKYSVRALAEGLNAELAQHGVSVTLINPGFIDTEIRKLNNDQSAQPAAADPVPSWLMMGAAPAARKIRRAIARRTRERAITAHSQIGIWFSRFFPGTLALIFRLAARPR
jgi:short-subunit dehydrogenase